jgi:protein TonB
MNAYLQGFGISFILHGAAFAALLSITLGGAAAEKELLIVDFSNVSVGKPQEGGELPGPGPAPEAAPEPPEPVMQPEAPKPEPLVSKKSVPAPKKTDVTPPPQPAPRGQPSREATPESVQGQGAGKGSPGAQGAGPGRGAGREEGLAQGYAKTNFNYILTRIRRNLEYPSQARRMGLTGVSKYSFIIKLDGEIEDLKLEESSGRQILDEAARRAILRAAPFPAPPVPARIIIPISFRLT